MLDVGWRRFHTRQSKSLLDNHDGNTYKQIVINPTANALVT